MNLEVVDRGVVDREEVDSGVVDRGVVDREVVDREVNHPHQLCVHANYVSTPPSGTHPG